MKTLTVIVFFKVNCSDLFHSRSKERPTLHLLRLGDIFGALNVKSHNKFVIKYYVPASL